MIADCFPPPSPNTYTHWVTLRKLLPYQGPSRGDLCGSGPIRRPGSSPRLRWSLSSGHAPVEGALLQAALEGRQGWQTAAGVK